MQPQLSLLGPLLALALLSHPVALESAPALLWSSQPPSPDAALRFNTLVDQIEPNDLLADFAKSGVTIVAFVQKDLNVEQFAANDAPYVSAIFDNLEFNPVLYTNVKNPRKIYSSFETDPSAASENIVIYLPGNSLKENDEFIKSHTEKFNASGPVAFILTGETNEQLKENKRARRQTVPRVTTFAVQPFPKVNPCGLVYATGAAATLVKKDPATKEDPQIYSFGPPTVIDGANTKCSSASSEASSLELNFKNTDTTKTDELVLIFEFSVANATGSWFIDSVNVKFGSSYSGETKLLSSVSTKFSYSCQKAVIPLNETDKDYSGSVVIQSFQLQPFYTTTTDLKNARFNDSSDCAVWFTLPIWMGLLVVLLLISILYFGVIALMSIITPDRFENPKGRGLIITNVEE